MTTTAWIDRNALERPDRVAIVDANFGHETTYKTLADRVARAANGLRRLGAERGDRVGIVAFNSSEYFEALYACARIGAIAVPINHRLSEREVRALSEDFTPKVVLGDTALRGLSTQLTAGGTVPVVLWGQSAGWEDLIAASEPDAAAFLSPADPWVIVYTSGTTGRPKGVVHSFASITADIDNSATAGGVDEKSTALSFLAPFHVAGMNAYANPILRAGGTLVLMRGFEVRPALELLASRRYPITHFAAPSAVLQMLAAVSDFDLATLPPLTTTVGGSPIPADLLAMWIRLGWRMIPVYGATEAGSTVTATVADGRQDAGVVGMAMPRTRVRVVDPAGTDCGPDELGEIWIGGDSLMLGYWQRPDETAEAVVDGWYHTGDVASRDREGRLRIVDRLKDMFISGAENVYPAEVESVLFEHEAVGAVAVIGVPDARWGEVGMAFVVLRHGAEASVEDLREYCSDQLARYKIPTHFRFVDDLPRGGSGKVLKSELLTGDPN